MILVAFNHGLRASEITGFTAAAVRDGHLTVQRLKGSLKTTQPLIESDDPLLSEKDALQKFARRARLGRPVFNISRFQFWRIVKKHALSAGINAHLAHPHVLKHSVAKMSIRSAGIENVRQFLGHKSLASTGAYLRVSDDEAARAVRAALFSSEQEK